MAAFFDQAALTSRFLSEEATPAVRSKLREALAAATTDRRIELRDFTFNVFDVRLDFVAGLATISDALDATAEAVLPLAEFAEALES